MVAHLVLAAEVPGQRPAKFLADAGEMGLGAVALRQRMASALPRRVKVVMATLA